MDFEATAEEPPLYRQLKDYIIERILAGDWAPGSRVPSEAELVSQFDVSRMTVHRALRELMTEGWITRVQGAGTFVAEQKPQSSLLEIRNIRDEIVERGHSWSVDVLFVEQIETEDESVRALEIRGKPRVFHSVLLHREDGVPVQVEDRYVNPAFAPHYLDQDFTKVTPYEYLTALGPLDAAEHVIEALLPSQHERRYLKMKVGEPCLVLTRRTWSNGLVVSRARLSYPGSRYRLAGRQDFRPGPQKNPEH